MSNSYVTVEREKISGHIEGSDFGYNCSVIARSPEGVLMWSAGTAYTSGRQTRYGESHLSALPDRSFRACHSGRLPHVYIGEHGGRLSFMRIMSNRAQIADVMCWGDPTFYAVANAVRRGRTLLIDGGGPALTPNRHLGPDAYAKWKLQEVRGFINPELR